MGFPASVGWDALPSLFGGELVCIGKMEAKGLKWSSTSTISLSSWFHRNCAGDHCTEETCQLGPDWILTFYNVLWVEWEDDIAYRKSIGKVWSDYWDIADKDEIDVRLG